MKEFSLMNQFPDALDFNSPEALIPLFDMSEIVDHITCTLSAENRQIRLACKVNDVDLSLTVDLSGAAGHTKPWQVVTAAKLFWYCYPQMYARFATAETPRDVILLIEDFDYEIACAWENKVHIHDRWLMENPTDFDCLTHEFAHTVQGDWQDEYMPANGDDTYMVERFADYCRFLYAFEDGRFNDPGWELQTPEGEDNLFDSVRFWVWLDYTYSTPEWDIIREMNARIHLCSLQYGGAAWQPDGSAWQEILAPTGAAGKTLLDLWEEYAASEMAYLSSGVEREGEVSPLLQALPLREAIRTRYAHAREYLKVQ